MSNAALVRSAGGIALCLLLAALLSYLRAWLAGTVKVDDLPPSQERAWIDAALGVCLLVAGALHVRTCWRGAGRDWRQLVAAAVAIQFAAAIALPLTSNDIFSNLANGSLVLHGMNPYVQSPAALGSDDPLRQLVGSQWLDKPTPYGPIVTYVSTLAAMAGSYWKAVVVFKSAMLACSLGCVLLAYRFCRGNLPSEHAGTSFVLLGWNPLLAWEISGQAHNDALMLLGTVGFVWAATVGRHGWAWSALMLAFCSKIAVVPVVGLYLVSQLRQSPVRAAAMLAAGGAVAAALFAPFWHGSVSLESMLHAGHNTPDKIANSLLKLAYESVSYVRPQWEQPFFQLWTATACVGCGALAVALAWRTLTVPGVLVDSLVFMLVYECLATAWFLPWYATWLVPLAMGCRQVVLQRAVALLCATVPLHYMPINGIALGYVLVPLLPLAVLARDRSWLKVPLRS